MFFSVKFFTPKLMKIRWSSLLFGSFAPHFQINLSTHGSNLNSIFVIMNELELFFLTGALTQNFNTVDLVKFLEKNQKLHI
jgi:tellurite resistance protein TehA-like permease